MDDLDHTDGLDHVGGIADDLSHSLDHADSADESLNSHTENRRDNFITLLTATYPSELAVIRSLLESEGIETFVKDELTVQTYSLSSNAMGGVKLQVKQADFEKASEMLKEAGSFKEEVIKPNKFWQCFARFTSKIPLLKLCRLELRFLILVAFISAFFFTVGYFVSLPSLNESLTDNEWCIDFITCKGQEYRPNLGRSGVRGTFFCDENLDLSHDGRIAFPGVNHSSIWGEWTINGKILTVTKVDTLQEVFQGNYEVDISNGEMILKSPTTFIYCYQIQPW